ncbi:MAG: ketoacyl-ACP synthase III [Bdellovibrionales bacterium]|nr:ketoacyl-ACP synthase III [Bdellovibrionales bacterium]
MENHRTAQISGTGSYLPANLLTNKDLESLVETSDQWIRERTGIVERHIAAPQEATSDLAFQAARQALDAAQLSAQDLDGILVATVTPDQVMPNTACFLQSRLGCKSIMALDVSAACSGFLYALTIADQFICSGKFKHILVIGAETLSRIINPTDRQTCILFGDGAGAVVLSANTNNPSSKSAILSSSLGANGSLGDLLSLPGGGSRLPFNQDVLDQKLYFVHMKGREIFKSAVRTMSDRALECLNQAQYPLDKVDWFIMHQANLRIIEAVADHLNIPKQKILTNIDQTGNTSSASIPILFNQSIDKNLVQRGQTILMAAFGAGLTSGGILLQY